MKYIVDHIARKGQTHTNCEDNALSFYKADLPFGIVSDGCSSEKNSQFISSFLCNYYKREVLDYAMSLSIGGMSFISHNWYIDNVFATMIYNFYNTATNNLQVSFIGDGAFFIKFKNKELQWYIIEQNDFPLYPEYSLERFKDKAMIRLDRINIQSNVDSGIKNFGGILSYWSDNIRIEINKDTNSTKFLGQIDFNINLISEIDYYGFCSDGVNTFHSDGQAIAPEIIINELCDIKLRKENFLQRRINIMSKKYKHDDDFSCVMFVKEN